MAISRAQLVKELLPGLNDLFEKQYQLFRVEQGTKFMAPENKKRIEEITLQVAYDLWTVAFGSAINTDEFYEKVHGNEYLMNISQYLYESDLLKVNLNNDRYYLAHFPEAVKPCR
jgi:hypothetical protein